MDVSIYLQQAIDTQYELAATNFWNVSRFFAEYLLISTPSIRFLILPMQPNLISPSLQRNVSNYFLIHSQNSRIKMFK